MLGVNYKNLLKDAYPEITKVFNLETAAYLHNSTVANVSILTFYYPRGNQFISSGYLVGLEIESLDILPINVKYGGVKITDPIRTLQDLFEYEELIDPQVTFDFVSWFKATQKINPCEFLDKKYHNEVLEIL